MFSKLFSPVRIGSMELENRLVVAPMDTGYGIPDNRCRVTEQHIAYWDEKTRGDWGLVIVEANAVIERGNAKSRDMDLCSDDQLPGHVRLVQTAHQNGTKICAQLVHSGRQSTYIGHGPTPSAPSPIADPLMDYTPTEMTEAQIGSLIESFGTAAFRAKEAGYDAVEIHGAHGYLISEFLSPYANRRTDRYGGSLEGRARLALEIVKKIKCVCGEDYPVIFRISSEDVLPHGEGLRLAETLALAQMLERAGADAIHASLGNYTSIQYMIPPAAVEHGLSAHLSEEIKKVVDIPVINVGRYTDPYVAEAALRADRCDLVSMGRQSLADPDFPKKARMGAVEEIRHCVGCQIGCIENLWKGTPIHCMVNPRIGYEAEFRDLPEKAEQTERILVIGGGVGGMEAAISAAEIGHDVTLWEASDRLGGQFNLACMPPYKQELATLVVWQKNRLEQLGVKVRLGHPATAAEILAQKADRVILATGARPAVPPFPGVDLPHVVNHAQVLSAEAVVGGRVAVISGGDVGCETAAFIASTGKHAEVFEMMDAICPKMENSVKYFLTEYLREKNVKTHTGAKVLEIREHAVRYEQDGEEREYGPVDTVVIAVGSKPFVPLLVELEGKTDVTVIGDAAGVRRGIDAVAEGFRAGRGLSPEDYPVR